MALPDEYLSIDTPENVAFDYEVAGIGTRFLAALVDTLVILVLQVVASITLLLFTDILVGDEQEVWLLAAVIGLISFAFLWGYYVFFEVIWNGQSLGKRWVGLRVIRTDGSPITLVESLIRNIIRLVDFLPAYYGVGVVTMFINEQSRRLGDLAAGTLVVRDRPTVTLESLAVKPALRNRSLQSFTAEMDLPIERLTSQDIQMAEDFLRRRDQLSNPSVVAKRIAQALFERMGIPVDQAEIMYAYDLILEIVQASQRAQGATTTDE